ncbi:MAG: DNA recombination protein RmuC [Burkholderiales bacterium]|nr:DNA recombination protein RmuC [Burkholderiales bacterium]
MFETLVVVLALVVIGALVFLSFKLGALTRAVNASVLGQAEANEQRQHVLVAEVRDHLERQGDRLSGSLTDGSERLRAVVSSDLKHAREAMQVLQLSQQHELATFREAVLSRLADMSLAVQSRLSEQGSADRDVMQRSLKDMAQELRVAMESLAERTNERMEQIRVSVDQRLEQIRGNVSERLDEGFRKTNETFTNVMTRLAVIDEAQKKIDGLTTNVVSLQELLGDKRARGAFGEVQLEALVRNCLPPNAWAMQATLSNGARVDCVLKLPEPTGAVAVDSKFPLENYHRMYTPGLSEAERLGAERMFKADLRKHVDDIGAKYIIPGETSEGAVMFVPAEAVFAEIHAYHRDVIDHALAKRVWIVSPTTLMAVLNTARAVLKDVETRRQVHVIKDALAKLAKDFARFDERMRKLADHIRQAHEDAQGVHVSSAKISQRFAQIESVEFEHPEAAGAELLAAAAPEPLEPQRQAG